MNMVLGKSKKYNIKLYSLVILPLISIIGLISFYFHAALLIGHMPFPSLDDPKNLSIYHFYAPIIILSSSTNIFCFFIWLLPAIVYNLNRKNRVIWQLIFTIIVLQIFVVCLSLSDIAIWFGD